MFEGLFHKKEKTADDMDNIRELTGTRAAILACEGFEESELFEPKKALEDVGVEVVIVSPEEGKIKSWTGKNWGKSIDVDMSVVDAFQEEFDYLVLPGGVINPDKLRN